MSLSTDALKLRDELLNDDYASAGTLETELTTNGRFGSFVQLISNTGICKQLFSADESMDPILESATAWGGVLNSSVALTVIAGSDYATKKLTEDGDRLADIFDEDLPGLFDHWRNNTANYTRIKNRINATGSKLKREIFTSGGTWTKPTTPLKVSIAAVGGGGGGDNDPNVRWAGGGGELKVENLSTLPTENLTIAIGSGGNGGTGIGASDGGDTTAELAIATTNVITASGGTGGDSSSGPGGGFTTNGGYAAMTDYLIEEAVFQVITASQKGGDGGQSRVSSGQVGDAGEDCTPFSGGRPGYDSANLTPGGGPGRKYGGGGGGGSATSTGPDTDDAEDGSGGGGGAATESSNSGGDGGNGILVVYWVEQ